MKIYEKIKFLRQHKGWSQEEMAEKLQMSVSGYANIERGLTDVQISRLEQVSEILGINVLELLSFGEKNLQLVLLGDNNQLINSSEEQLQNKLEQALFKIEQQQKEINYLKEIIELLKKDK
ncbi:helix-turn-helix transcriptional regulator [Candidatus Halobeggiatoa sp. HSG11]|nr:helix-turn-helix transcriptional regulator [Candidatus Halobeggiatoa sp. HSG11]